MGNIITSQNITPKNPDVEENNTTSKSYITLRSLDGGKFEVPEAVAKVSPTICQMIEDDYDKSIIPIHNVTATTLAMVIEYCKKHVKATDASKIETAEPDTSMMSAEALKNWDQEFIDVDIDTLYDLIMAADYLKINGLMDLACEKVAYMIKGRSVEELRQMFNIENGFIPEVEEEHRRLNPWAFD
ncbi:SKP1 [Rhynchospora pubera]|uniref:SKP1-like protein n=1 Tax=Rhynchospora pubera TaxID=906938 RepID=A0AAV8DFM1_9POAL|nr:SKP1 [Rhynchospora pubera]